MTQSPSLISGSKPQPAPHAAQTLHCPNCQRAESLSEIEDGQLRCRLCRWTGQVYAFTPPPRQVDRVEAAMPDDITCAYHPTKKALHVCAGTGSYICSLCMVEVAGQTYSAAFVNEGGLKKINKPTAFDRTMNRPDYTVNICALLIFFPYTSFLAPILVPIGVFNYIKHRRLINEDPLYARVVSRWTPLLAVVFLILIGLAMAAGVIALSIFLIAELA